MSRIRIDDLFELNEKKYITLDKIEYNSNEYIFVNKLSDDENPTNIFKTYKCSEERLIEEKNNNILEKILPVFSENVNKKLETINEQYLSEED